MHRIKRAYSGKDNPAASTPPRRPSSSGRDTAPALGLPAGEVCVCFGSRRCRVHAHLPGPPTAVAELSPTDGCLCSLSCSSEWLQQLQDAKAQPAAQRKAASGGRVHPDREGRDKLVGGQLCGPHCTWWASARSALDVLSLICILLPFDHARCWINGCFCCLVTTSE